MKLAPLALLAAGLTLAAPARAQVAYPEDTRAPLADLADVLTPAQEDRVVALLAEARGTGADVRVVTLGSVRDYAPGATSIETFATGLFNAWRIGDRAENDGALLLVAVRDRRVRIELGDGAPRSFDARARRLIDTQILPAFREGDYAGGIQAGAAGIAGWYAPSSGERPASGGGWGLLVGLGVCLAVGAGVGGLFYLSEERRSARAKRPSRGVRCPECHAPGLAIGRETLRPATHQAPGAARATQHCPQCGYRREWTVTIPQRVTVRRRVARAWADRSWPWSDDAGWYPSSHSGGSGSSGGGHSSGRGASGSW